MTCPITRRFFLREATGAAVASTVASEVIAEPAGIADDFWTMVRRQFTFSEAKVPMNAANLCPSPRIVAERVAELTRSIDRDCSFQNRAQTADWLEASRAAVAAQMGVNTDEIALVRNTSEANNVINNGLTLEAGDEVVAWDQNHPTNNVAWRVRAARFGFGVRRVSTPASPKSVDELVDTFTRAFTAKTRVLTITHVSNTSGIRLPVKALCEAAHKRNIHVHVDGAQTWGALDVNLREMGCDSYSASAHKWFMGPKEVGLLYVRRDRIERIWPNVVSVGWGEQIEPAAKGARKFETLGQRDDAALAAVAVAVEFIHAIGQRRVESRVQELAQLFKNHLHEMGLSLVTPLDESLSAGVCIVAVPPDRRAPIFDRLYREYGIAGAPTGGLRLCPHIYNTKAHVQRAVAAIKAMRHLFT